MRQYMLGRAAHRFKSGATAKNLFYYLVRALTEIIDHITPTDGLQSNEDGAEKQQPSTAQVVSEGILATVAASDTTSAAMGSAFWLVLSEPCYYKRLQAEINKF
jgi:cytochrome P450